MFRRLSSHQENDFHKDIPQCSDEQLIEILKLRDHYQDAAAKLAIEEAIKRGIISSEQDLFAEEYRVKDIHTSLFPEIKNEENKTKIRRSISRSLVLLGILPTIFGFVQINKGVEFEGGGLVILGAVWILISAQLGKRFQLQAIYTLFALAFIGLVYVYLKLSLAKNIAYFDYFLPAVLFMLLIYALLFLRKIAGK